MSFTDQTLQTKLFIPPARSAQVRRSRVLSKLEQGLGLPVTLVSAPAGFGKTTLLSEWAAETRTLPLAWLSLDPEDNDLPRFLVYLAASLNSLKEGINSSVIPLLQMNRPPEPRVILTSLINELIESLPKAFIQVLDDYHVITSQEVHEALLFLIENLPPKMRLVIISREDPPLPLARLRARRQLTEIRAADLRFTEEESASFLNQVMGLDLDDGEVKSLESRTEGWIAGLQMAAISLKGHQDKARFIGSFASSNHFIFDYLIEEALDRQSPEIKEFLMKTSALDRMCAPLCDAVVGGNDAQATLVQLEQMNLFVVPLDDQRRWYRYHHLFAELVRQQLHLTYGEMVPDLHQRACAWYRENGLIGGAIHHALRGRDVEAVARMAEHLVFSSMERHELLELSSWIGSLPGEIMKTKPLLSVAFSWMLVRAQQLEQAEAHLHKAEQALADWPGTQEQQDHMAGHTAAISAHLALIKGKPEQVITMARKSLDMLPEHEKRLRGVVLSLLGTSLQRTGNFEEAVQAFTEGIVLSRMAGDLVNSIETYGDLTGYYVERGQLYEAFSTCQEASQLIESCFEKGGRYPAVAAYIEFRLSTIQRHWNDLDLSMQHARKAAEITSRWGYHNRLVLINLAIAHHSLGQYDNAVEVLRQAEKVAEGESGFWVEQVKSVRALLYVYQGRIEDAVRWAQESGLSDQGDIRYQQQQLYLTFARVLISQGIEGDAAKLEMAIRILIRLQALFEGSNAQAYLLQVFIYQALTYQGLRKKELALSAARQALFIGEFGGFIRVFVREGDPMRNLLIQAVGGGYSSSYSRKLLSAFGGAWNNTAAEEGKSAALVELLTPRELEVLRLLGTELSMPELADELVLSVETLRTHVKRIYRKLDVHSRFEAFTRAEKLGLL